MSDELSKRCQEWIIKLYPILAAFAWYNYQKVGRGFLLVDLTQSDELNEWTPAVYVTIADAETEGWFSLDETMRERVEQVDPAAGIVVNFVLAEGRAKVIGMGKPTLPPPDAYELHRDDMADWERGVH